MGACTGRQRRVPERRRARSTRARRSFGKIQSKKTHRPVHRRQGGRATRRCARSRSAPRTWARGRRLRRLPVHVLQRALVARRHQPAAGGDQPARDLRAHVRRDRHRRSSGSAQPAARSRACSTRSPRKPRGCERTLGAADNAILDEYLTNIREVEQQLDRMEARARHAHRRRPMRRSACPKRSTIT